MMHPEENDAFLLPIVIAVAALICLAAGIVAVRFLPRWFESWFCCL